ncbi:peptidoglycan/LPS O-acetylase OafA/YrhL [Sphingomonas jinjuensis]|uniref:Peptidoglycan/LPS O-acetylase OafA/YrhL n=1 Tax=Sphingomonas jinjuensis TaxID=535907 RepID=A0A840FE09_9SPHN|nr:acyltransferase [Sphingomonas jinjuensis]MBB4152258.1 peptidoglycan/LPS O-acetylase OafA/YrhL [Sphingomonas jinjuensis]
MTALANEDRSATGRRRVFHLLDAIRGLAAFAVAQRHAAWLMGIEAWPSTYLAVDLFFMLSGFVIAFSYERRLIEGMSWRHFMVLRVIRLYPLYLVGLALGLIALVGHEVQKPHPVDWTMIGEALFSAALMLPNWGLPAIVGPRWSLTYELVANAGYAALVRRLGAALLAGIIAVAGAVLIAEVARNGTIDLGWEYWQMPTALARVCFSFGIGVLLYRLHDGKVARHWAWVAAGIVGALSIAAFVVVGGSYLTLELLLVFLLFPALTVAAASVDVGPRGAVICGILGTTSYALYVIHQPAALLWEAGLKRVFGADAMLVPWAGWVLLPILGVVAWLLDRYYDTPVRRRLVAAYNGARGAKNRR